jgi:hypothetical protein
MTHSKKESLESWNPDGAVHLPFRVDLYLGTGPTCLSPKAKQEILYRDIAEGSCVRPVD